MAKDLFDLKRGGSGWIMTAHLLGIVALFVACFAITGYISFQDETIPGSALKKNYDVEFNNVKLNKVDLNSIEFKSGFGVEKTYSLTIEAPLDARTDATRRSLGGFGILLPKGCFITDVYANFSVGTNIHLADTVIRIGTTEQCQFDGQPSNDNANKIKETEIADTTVDNSGLHFSPEIQSFRITTNDTDVCITSNTATAITKGKINVGIKVFFPPGITPP